MGSFAARLEELAKQIGTGPLTGKVEVDQPYALKQHEALHFEHTSGGGAKFLEKPLYANRDDYMRRLANAVVCGDLTMAMVENVEHLSGEVEIHAPTDDEELRGSGHPTVSDNGQVTYDRAPRVARLEGSRAKREGG